ncbi:hypothetical protein TNCV_1056421, partial [Trichonephila clavipes]
DFNLFEIDSRLDDHQFSSSMWLEYRIILLGSLTGVENNRSLIRLEHPVAKPLAFAARLVGFSIRGWSLKREKMGDIERMTDADKRIHCILNRSIPLIPATRRIQQRYVQHRRSSIKSPWHLLRS